VIPVRCWSPASSGGTKSDDGDDAERGRSRDRTRPERTTAEAYVWMRRASPIAAARSAAGSTSAVKRYRSVTGVGRGPRAARRAAKESEYEERFTARASNHSRRSIPGPEHTTRDQTERSVSRRVPSPARRRSQVPLGERRSMPGTVDGDRDRLRRRAEHDRLTRRRAPQISMQDPGPSEAQRPAPPRPATTSSGVKATAPGAPVGESEHLLREDRSGACESRNSDPRIVDVVRVRTRECEQRHDTEDPLIRIVRSSYRRSRREKRRDHDWGERSIAVAPHYQLNPIVSPARVLHTKVSTGARPDAKRGRAPRTSKHRGEATPRGEQRAPHR